MKQFLFLLFNKLNLDIFGRRESTDVFPVSLGVGKKGFLLRSILQHGDPEGIARGVQGVCLRLGRRRLAGGGGGGGARVQVEPGSGAGIHGGQRSGCCLQRRTLLVGNRRRADPAHPAWGWSTGGDGVKDGGEPGRLCRRQSGGEAECEGSEAGHPEMAQRAGDQRAEAGGRDGAGGGIVGDQEERRAAGAQVYAVKQHAEVIGNGGTSRIGTGEDDIDGARVDAQAVGIVERHDVEAVDREGAQRRGIEDGPGKGGEPIAAARRGDEDDPVDGLWHGDGGADRRRGGGEG